MKSVEEMKNKCKGKENRFGVLVELKKFELEWEKSKK
jgi:hypothetical protein